MNTLIRMADWALASFVVSFLVSLFVSVFGTSAIDSVRSKLSIGTYLRNMNKVLVEELGDGWATIVKLCLVGFAAAFVLFNWLNAVSALIFGCVGVWASKSVYSVPAINDAINRVATWVNRNR